MRAGGDESKMFFFFAREEPSAYAIGQPPDDCLKI